jgi:ubiquitin-protein ligase
MIPHFKKEHFTHFTTDTEGAICLQILKRVENSRVTEPIASTYVYINLNTQ